MKFIFLKKADSKSKCVFKIRHIEDGATCEISEWLKTINSFSKEFCLRCVTWFCMGLPTPATCEHRKIFKVCFQHFLKHFKHALRKFGPNPLRNIMRALLQKYCKGLIGYSFVIFGFVC